MTLNKQIEDSKTQHNRCNKCGDPITGTVYNLTGVGDICVNCWEKEASSEQNRKDGKPRPSRKGCKFCGNKNAGIHINDGYVMCHSCSMANRNLIKED